MYCGSCLHDNTLATALLARGHDVLLTPTYTPMRTDEPSVAVPRVFVGGVNAYLEQASGLFRNAPGWLRRLLNHPGFLKVATSGAGSVDPAGLGPLTVSMLRGEAGNQQRSIDELVDWLVDEARPDVVHLSNSMLLGMARRIQERCGPPVVCALSGEDVFLEALPAPYYDQARELLRERAAEVAAFTTLNAYYADFMADYLSVDRGKIHVIPHGLSLEGIDPVVDRPEKETFVVGFFGRICHTKGLHLLMEACELIAENAPEKPIELRAAGYLGAADREYLVDLHRQADHGQMAGRFAYLGEMDRSQKYEYLRSLDLFCSPAVYAEAKGIPALEAMAVGTPVVAPNEGSFPELIEVTSGGALHEPRDAESLAEVLLSLLEDRETRRGHGQAGAAAIREDYHADRMASQTESLYETLVKSGL